MATSSEQEKSAPKHQSKNLVLIVLVLLVLISGVKLVTDHQKQTEKSAVILQLTTENEGLTARLDSVETELILRIKELQLLGADVRELQLLRNQLAEEKKSTSQRTAAEMETLNQKIASLGTLLLQKDREIKQLQSSNDALLSENAELKTAQTSLEEEMASVNQEKAGLAEKVAEAAKLKASFVRISAVNARGKEVVESSKSYKGRQMKAVKVVLTLAENTLAEKGMRTVYLQLLGPTKQPIFDVAKGSGTFLVSGEEQFYTSKQEVLYDNQEQALIFLFEKGSAFSLGKHEVKLFIDDYAIPGGSFTIQ
jgi:chromosome segregation ATPase